MHIGSGGIARIREGRSATVPDDLHVVRFLTGFRLPERVHQMIPQIVQAVIDGEWDSMSEGADDLGDARSAAEEGEGDIDGEGGDDGEADEGDTDAESSGVEDSDTADSDDRTDSPAGDSGKSGEEGSSDGTSKGSTGAADQASEIDSSSDDSRAAPNDS
jgi:hypothetical protein